MNTDQKKQFTDLVTSIANNAKLTKIESVLTIVLTLESEGRINELFKTIQLHFPEYFTLSYSEYLILSFPEHLKN